MTIATSTDTDAYWLQVAVRMVTEAMDRACKKTKQAAKHAELLESSNRLGTEPKNADTAHSVLGWVSTAASELRYQLEDFPESHPLAGPATAQLEAAVVERDRLRAALFATLRRKG